MLACQAIAICWYATAGHHPADAEARRLDAPWYTSKTEPSTADMTAKLRRVIIAAKFKPELRLVRGLNLHLSCEYWCSRNLACRH